MLSNMKHYSEAQALADRLADQLFPDADANDRQELTAAIMGYRIIPAIMSQLKDMAHDAMPSSKKAIRALYDDLNVFGQTSDEWDELKSEIRNLCRQ